MSNLITNYSNQKQFSISPANGRQTVGDGAFSVDSVNPEVVAVCQVQGSDDMYYYRHVCSLLRSRAGARGVFDAPSEKVPPDISSRGIDRGGSLGSVTGWPTSRSSSLSSDSDSSNSSISPSHPPAKGGNEIRSNVVYPHTPPHSNPALDNENFCGGDLVSTLSTALKDRISTSVPHSTPRDIPNLKHVELNGGTNRSCNPYHNQATPPLTPDASPESGSAAPFDEFIAARDDAAHDFLLRLFPGSARVALKHAKSVRISSSELAVELPSPGSAFAFEGVVLEAPGHARTLYIDGKGAENVKLRESIVALLDLADEHLECSALVISLERSSPALVSLLHSFLYVGATVVSRPPYPLDDAYVLVGIEI